MPRSNYRGWWAAVGIARGHVFGPALICALVLAPLAPLPSRYPQASAPAPSRPISLKRLICFDREGRARYSDQPSTGGATQATAWRPAPHVICARNPRHPKSRRAHPGRIDPIPLISPSLPAAPAAAPQNHHGHIAARIVRIENFPDAPGSLHLDNDQVWQQIQGSPRLM